LKIDGKAVPLTSKINAPLANEQKVQKKTNELKFKGHQLQSGHTLKDISEYFRLEQFE
jgi:hypothetical protein